MLDRFLIYMASQAWFGSDETAGDILRALETSTHFAPTGWTAEDGARAADYDRAAVADALAGAGGRAAADVQLLRSKAPKYRLDIAADRDGLNHLKLTLEDSAGRDVAKAVFDLGDALAAALKPEYALVHAWRKGSDRKAYRLSANMTFFDLQKTGPRPPGAQTWTGKHIGALDVAGFVVEEAGASRTKWGGRVFDLVPEPWAADEADLAEAQAALLEKLRPAGIWGDYSGVVPKPGPNWKPVGEPVI